MGNKHNESDGDTPTKNIERKRNEKYERALKDERKGQTTNREVKKKYVQEVKLRLCQEYTCEIGNDFFLIDFFRCVCLCVSAWPCFCFCFQ